MNSPSSCERRLPPEWRQAALTYRFGDTTYDITIAADCDTPRQVDRMTLYGLDPSDVRPGEPRKRRHIER